MNKKELILYVAGGVVFTVLYIIILVLLFGLFMSTGGNRVVEFVGTVLFSIYAPANIKINNCMIFVSVYTYLFLLGGMLSLLFCYNYNSRQSLKNQEIVNPISKKSLFISIAVFIGFVLLVRSIAWLGGF